MSGAYPKFDDGLPLLTHDRPLGDPHPSGPLPLPPDLRGPGPLPSDPLSSDPGPLSVPSALPRGRRIEPWEGLGADPALPEYQPGIALRGISGHIARTSTGMTAWYRLRPRPWSMRPDAECEALINSTGLALNALAGRWLHMRVLWRPFPAAAWARRHDQWAAPLPDQPNTPGWAQWLVACQREALVFPYAVKETYVGVEIHAGRRGVGRLADRLAGRGPRRLRTVLAKVAETEIAALDDEVTHLDRMMASSALGASPVSAAGMWTLLHRSCGLGLPASAATPTAPHGQWDSTDLAGPDSAARWSAEPYAPSIRVEGLDPTGRRVTRHVVIASLGQMGELDIPAVHLPWMHTADTLGAGIEWSARLRVLDSQHAARALRHVADRVDAQQRHYEIDHGLAAPPVLARQISRAAQVRDELETDHSGLSARCEGWWRLAISADTEQDALKVFSQLQDAYHPAIAIERGPAQYACAREFVPGEPLATTAFRRRMSVRHLAMALPQVTDIIGDDHGPLMFTTAGGRPVAWDPWAAIDHRQVSGLTPVIGNQGAGKTFLIGTLAYHAVRSAQAYVTLIDPSGPLTRLTQLPELAGHARAVSLMDSPAGTLNPYRVVPAPAREQYPDGAAGDAEYAYDAAAADAARTTLVTSVLTGLLPASIRRDGDNQAALLDAIGQVGPSPQGDPRDVVAALKQMADPGPRLAGAFAPILADHGPARLLLGHPEAGGWDATTDRLLVISTHGLTLPGDGTDPLDWTIDEQLSLALMHLTSWLAYRRVYRLPRQVPKLVGLDELRALSLLPSGRTLVTQFARDSRKFRVRALIAGQLASDVLRLGAHSGDTDSGLAGLCHDVLVGRTTGDTAQSEALRLLRVPTGVGYEHQLGQLSGAEDAAGAEIDPSAPTSEHPDTGASGGADAPRGWLWRSGELCELVYLDTSGPHLAGLRSVLDTNAARARECS